MLPFMDVIIADLYNFFMLFYIIIFGCYPFCEVLMFCFFILYYHFRMLSLLGVIIVGSYNFFNI
jgi:hypothetical protein